MSDKEKLMELLRKAKVKEGIYTSDRKLIEAYDIRAVNDEIVECLADYLIAHGVTVTETR